MKKIILGIILSFLLTPFTFVSAEVSDLTFDMEKDYIELVFDIENPAVYQNKMVYTDTQSISSYLYLYDFNAKTLENLNIKGYEPDIFGDNIVYTNARDEYGIYVYNLSSGQERQIGNYYSYETKPLIYGDNIVWKDVNKDTEEEEIYLYNLNTSQTETIYSSGWSEDEGGMWGENYFDIYGDKIIYFFIDKSLLLEDGDTKFSMKIYDISSKQEKIIRYTSLPAWFDAYSGGLNLYQNNLVFTGEDKEDAKYSNIYLYNIDNGTSKKITNLEYLYYSPKHLLIYEDSIVWIDNRDFEDDFFTSDGFSDGGQDIYVYDLESDKEYRLTPNSFEGGYRDVALFGDTLVYTSEYADDYNNIDTHIYKVKINQEEFNNQVSDQNENENSTQIIDQTFAKNLAGRLLLQVEDRGRIWYVSPEDYNKSEVTFANALPLFEKQAIGITNENLYKIPINPNSISADVDSDNDGFSDKSEVNAGYNPEIASNPNQRGNDKFNLDINLANQNKGKLFLQVEDRGRIWYVDMDGYRWEITWDNLMNVFRNLALGITNSDLNKINESNL